MRLLAAQSWRARNVPTPTSPTRPFNVCFGLPQVPSPMAAVQGSALSKHGDVEEEAQVRRAIAASLAYGGSATGSSTGGSASADDVGLTACQH